MLSHWGKQWLQNRKSVSLIWRFSVRFQFARVEPSLKSAVKEPQWAHTAVFITLKHTCAGVSQCFGADVQREPLSGIYCRPQTPLEQIHWQPHLWCAIRRRRGACTDNCMTPVLTAAPDTILRIYMLRNCALKYRASERERARGRRWVLAATADILDGSVKSLWSRRWHPAHRSNYRQGLWDTYVTSCINWPTSTTRSSLTRERALTAMIHHTRDVSHSSYCSLKLLKTISFNEMKMKN